MRDIQNEEDPRRIEIDKVGVKGLSYPIIVLDRANKLQHTVAKVNMFVNLPHSFRGTHMSRFVEILNQYRGQITMKNMGPILKRMREVFQAESAHLEIDFPYFIEKEAPVSRAKSLMSYMCKFIGSLSKGEDFVLEVRVPVNTLCPCSKEISDRGAHNQRGEVRLQVRFKEFVWIEDLISLVEASASSGLYSLLKREDERWVTENAYDNPAFVEDVVRSLADKLLKDPNITWFSVEAENQESIHNHNAYAFLERESGGD
jgi:GTP cyclohydrolase I